MKRHIVKLHRKESDHFKTLSAIISDVKNLGYPSNILISEKPGVLVIESDIPVSMLRAIDGVFDAV